MAYKSAWHDMPANFASTSSNCPHYGAWYGVEDNGREISIVRHKDGARISTQFLTVAGAEQWLRANGHNIDHLFKKA